MKKTLGLDLGSNSLGWAIVDSEGGDILDAGVVVFDEGIKRVKGQDTLLTPAAERRAARMGRRLKFRRRLRKFALLKILIREKMCPLSIEGLKEWKQHDRYPVSDAAFMAWLKSSPERNPYADRARAASEQVDPQTLGRALYHLAQRRGFLSSRKDARDSDEEDKETGLVKSDIKSLSDELRKDGRDLTLGQYFYECFQHGIKVRARHTGRKEHYMEEFRRIMKAQNVPEALATEFWKALFFQRPLRSQKQFVGRCPLEPKHSRCQLMRPEFEEFRMLQLVNNLRVVEGETQRELTSEERDRAIAKFYTVARSITIEDIAKAVFVKRGKKGKDNAPALNYPPYKSVSTNRVSQQLNLMLKTEGDGYRAWRHPGTSRSGKPVEYDYNAILDAISFYQDDDMLAEFGRKRLGFTDEQAERLVKISFPDGYASYSLCAIGKMLPFLRQGLGLHEAQLLARFPDILGKERFEKEQPSILAEVARLYEDVRENRKAASENHFAKVVPFRERLGSYLANGFHVDADAIASLYPEVIHSDYPDRKVSGVLPPVELGSIRNPLVQRSMTILRRLVNHLRAIGKIDADTRIRVELARAVNDRNTRLAYEMWQKEREDKRAEAVQRIHEAGVAEPNDDQILRYILAEEQGWKCLYTGRQISMKDIVSSQSTFDIEHTMPRSRSGDDSQANKTLCDVSYNRKVKVGRLPTECPNYGQEDSAHPEYGNIADRLRPWEEMLEGLEKLYAKQTRTARATSASNPEAKSKNRQKAIATRFKRDYWRQKIRAFRMTDENFEDGRFLSRQLVDTGIMSSHAIDFLASVYHDSLGRPNVWGVNGAATAFARKAWGVQDTDSPKLRDNHVHHAIDAMVIAELSPARFTAICTMLKDDARVPVSGLERAPEPPLENFGQIVHDIAEGILVRHISFHKETKQTKRGHWLLPKSHKTGSGDLVSRVATAGDTVRGQLHADTFYGRIRNPETAQDMYVVRKSLVGPIAGALALCDKIVDPAIRRIVSERLDELKAEGATNIGPDSIKMPSGVPIAKVRIAAQTTNPQQLKNHDFPSGKDYKTPYYVASAAGSNFRLALFRKNGSVSVEPDNLLSWAQGRKAGAAPLDSKDGFCGYILPGCMALAHAEGRPEELQGLPKRELRNRLYKVVKFDERGRITFRHHTEARDTGTLEASLKNAGKNAKGESRVSVSSPDALLLLSTKTYGSQMLFEGIDFSLSLDGEVVFRH